MVVEVRRQFAADDKAVLKGLKDPDYKRCVAISTEASLREMVFN
jgi:Na+/H+-translocating membrane pyrophosphatase